MLPQERTVFRSGRGILSLLILPIFIFLSSSLVFAEWTAVSSPSVSSNWELYAVRFTSSNSGWAVGKDASNRTGVILRFVNGTWAPVSPPTVLADWELVGVDFVSANEGWVVGRDSTNRIGMIFRFLKESWTYFTPPQVSTDWELDSVCFTSSNDGWAVGKDSFNTRGVLLQYANGVWYSLIPPNASSDWELLSVHFPSPNEGWAVGTDNAGLTGILLHYSGGIWNLVPPPDVSSYWWLYAVHLTSSNQGWAVGTDYTNHRGVLLRYLNGSWNSVTPPEVSSDWGLWDIHFLSSEEGWAVGWDFENHRGVLLHYFENTWSSMSPPELSASWGLWGVRALSTMEAWAVGKQSEGSTVSGMLLKYTRPKNSVSPENLDYRNVTIGAFLDKSVTATNTGNGNLLFGTVTSPSFPFVKKADTCSGKTIAPLGSCKITYRFEPTSEETFTSTSDIPSNDPDKSFVTVSLSGTGISGPLLYIHLMNPPDGQGFDACAYSSPPTFQWEPSEIFKSFEVQFSLQEDFSTVPVKGQTKKGTTEFPIKPSLWKKLLLLPGQTGGTAYWAVTGTRDDKTKVESDIFSLIVQACEPVSNATLFSSSKTGPPPTLSWENNCNIKFKVWFSNATDFKKKTILSFKVQDPVESGGRFEVALTSGQWNSIRELVGDASGSRVYWYVESWDVLNRSAKTEVMSFVLTD